MQEVTPVTIPAQRTPGHDDVPLGPPGPPAEPPAPPRRRPLGVLVLMVLAVAVGLAVPAGDRSPVAIARGGTSAGTVPDVAPRPFDKAEQALDAQAAALLRGDERGWLAAVDPAQPALRKRYQALFRALRSLQVTQFEYHPAVVSPPDETVTTHVTITYCFSRTSCPAYRSEGDGGPALLAQRLTLKPGTAGYVISKLAATPTEGTSQPTPWEAGDLVFAQGKRVTVGARRPLAKRLPEMVKAADKAAVVADRIAGYMGNPQKRYRIFLATDADWKKWYGGGLPEYAVAYTIGLNESGSDVVLQIGELADRQELAGTLQHEMTHVATLSHLMLEDPDDLWLMEGVAEYAAWLPLHAGTDLIVPSVRSAFRGSNRPKSIVQAPLPDDAKQNRVNLFYGLGNYAVDCLSAKYGEARAMKFVRLKLRERKTLDTASRTAFGKPFATVDKACVTWIARQAG